MSSDRDQRNEEGMPPPRRRAQAMLPETRASGEGDGETGGLGILQMPNFIEQKAALIAAHFLLPAGATIVDMGCETGEITYVLAHLNPWINVIGIDQDRKMIDFANRTFKLPNLKFVCGDISGDTLDDGSVDGIVNSNILHYIYSNNGYDSDSIIDILESQGRKLKPGGTMLIRDYMMPPKEEFVLLEFPDVKSMGDQPIDLSDADLLIHFSQSARPTADGLGEGFYLEELSPRREKTRLFRLEHKWALEYVHRKDYRRSWFDHLHNEYTFFTYRDYRRELARLGMRVVYSSPHRNPWVIKNRFKGRFQLYNEEFQAMAWPATNYFIVAQKAADAESLIIEERRPSQKPAENLKVVLVRDKKSGVIHELVRRNAEYADIVPYRITRDNRLLVYVSGGAARPIVNAVSRGYANLDEKRWSGHLIEPISMDMAELGDDEDDNKEKIAGFLRRFAGLKVTKTEGIYVGDTYFPSPDRIDEAIEPVFAEVVTPDDTAWPIVPDALSDIDHGQIIELEADKIIRASQVGLLPDPRLELHVFDLMRRHGIAPPPWIGETMPKLMKTVEKPKDMEEILAEAETADFAEEKGVPKELKAVRSVFVDEGKVGRSLRGVKSRDVEFVISHDGIENIAVVFLLTRGWDNSVLVALEAKAMPVPQRLGGDAAMLTAPSFVLPKDVRTVEDAKSYVADKFGVTTDRVGQLGESYFTHVGVTPQRIYPFVVAAEGKVSHNKGMHLTMAKRLMYLGSFGRQSAMLLKGVTRLMMAMDADHGMTPDRKMENARSKPLKLSVEKIDLSIGKVAKGAVKSRVRGRRKSSRKPVPASIAAAPILKGTLTKGYRGALRPDSGAASKVSPGAVRPNTTGAVRPNAPDVNPVGRPVSRDPSKAIADAGGRRAPQMRAAPKQSKPIDEGKPVSLEKKKALQLNLDLVDAQKKKSELKREAEKSDPAPRPKA